MRGNPGQTRHRCYFVRNGRWALGNWAERNCFLDRIENILAWTERNITSELRKTYWLVGVWQKRTRDGCEPALNCPSAGNTIRGRPPVIGDPRSCPGVCTGPVVRLRDTGSEPHFSCTPALVYFVPVITCLCITMSHYSSDRPLWNFGQVISPP